MQPKSAEQPKDTTSAAEPSRDVSDLVCIAKKVQEGIGAVERGEQRDAFEAAAALRDKYDL